MSTPTKAIKELAEKIWMNATSHGHGEPIASQAKAIIAILAEWENEGTPTKAAEIIREALEAASKELDCSDWGEVDVNGEGALRPYSHDIVAMPHGCPSCKVRRALALLADMEREGEPVAWNDGDIEAAYLAGCINGASQEATGKTYWPSLDRVQAELQRLKENGIAIPSMIRSMRNKAHPSPTTADAMNSPVDVQEVIKAGDAMATRLNRMETGDGLQAVWKHVTKPFRP